MPVWTVFIELMGSAMMPFIVTVALARTRLFNWLLAGMGVAAYLLAFAPHRLDSLSCMFDFALGAWLASEERKLVAGGSSLRLFCAAVALLFFRCAWFAILNGHLTPLYFGYDDPVPMLVESVAAAFLVGELASEYGRLKFLRKAQAIRLGEISYSLYLVHFPVAIFLAKVLSRVFSNGTNAIVAGGVLTLFGLGFSILLAVVIHRFVELPTMALGKESVEPSDVGLGARRGVRFHCPLLPIAVSAACDCPKQQRYRVGATYSRRIADGVRWPPEERAVGIGKRTVLRGDQFMEVGRELFWIRKTGRGEGRRPVGLVS